MTEKLEQLLRVVCPNEDESTIGVILLDKDVGRCAVSLQDAVERALGELRAVARDPGIGGESANFPVSQSDAVDVPEASAADGGVVVEAPEAAVNEPIVTPMVVAEATPPDGAPLGYPPMAMNLPAPNSPETRMPPVADRRPSKEAPAKAAGAGHVTRFTLRNMRQGEHGEVELTVSPDLPSFELVDVRIPLELGLIADLATRRISGTPQASGDFVVSIQFRNPAKPELGVRTASVPLLVNADPKLLWKDLPSDTTDKYWKQDRAQQLIKGPTKNLAAARQRGRSHAHVGSFCDDDYHIAYLQNGWYVNVVADGAGSAKYSRHGSKIACVAAGELLRELLSAEPGDAVVAAARALVAGAPSDTAALENSLRQELYKTVGYAAHAAMRAHSAEVESESEVATLRELSTTLLIGIAREVDGRWLCASYWVGDGAVGVYRAGVGVDVLGEVDSGEYSGQTRFLDASEVSQTALWKRIRHVIVDNFTAFVLMTDGVSDAKFETEAKLMTLAAWDDLWAELQRGAAFEEGDDGIDMRLQAWLDFWSPGNHDDRTISILY